MRRLVVFAVLPMVLAGCASAPKVAAQDVANAFIEAGLPMANARDASDECGAPSVCTTRVASGDIVIYGYDSEAAAKDYAETLGAEHYQAGPIVLNYGSPTPEEDRPRYEAVLNALLDGG